MSEYNEKIKMARKVDAVFVTDDGSAVLDWLKDYVGYGAPSFIGEDGYDERAAAHRDGAKMVVWALVKMLELAHKTEEVDCD